MGAPAHTARSVPVGFKMPDGFKSLIAFSKRPAIQLWERDVKPPGIDGGEPINITTMHNVAWRTFFPKSLKTLDAMTFVAGYDPDVIADLLAMVNLNQSFTFFWPSGDYIDFWATMTKFEPGEMKEGEFPTATVTISPTNLDTETNPASPVESAPVYHAAAGT